MLQIQISITNLSCEQPSYQLNQIQLLIIRFGPVKIQLQLTLDGDRKMYGGKKILLDLSHQDFQSMLKTYSFGLFMENSNGKFFVLLSLEKLKIKDQVLNQELFFLNQQEQIAYTSNISLNFHQYKQPRLPANKQKIQTHKTFQDFFQKPAVPKANQNIQAKTLTNFIQKNTNINKTQQSIKSSGYGKVKSSNPVKGSKKLSSTAKINSKNKAQEEQERINFIRTQFLQKNNYNQDEQDNPPIIQFTNKQDNSSRPLGKTLFELNNTAPQHIKLAQIYQQSKPRKQSLKKSQQKKLSQTSKNTMHDFSKKQKKVQIKQNINYSAPQVINVVINRQQLKAKAKKQLQSYQGNKQVQIPIFRNGKYELVDLSQLSQTQITNYTRIQREKQQQEMRKQQMNEKLKAQARQNQNLKFLLEEKQKQLARQQEQAKKKKIQAMIRNRNNSYEISKSLSHTGKIEEEVQQSFQREDERMDSSQDYSSDFQSASLANSQLLRSRKSVKKKLDQSESFNESYDPDFESYSQSLLGGSQKKISLSEISQGSRVVASPKKY